MHPFFRESMIQQAGRELERRAPRAQLRWTVQEPDRVVDEAVTLRLARANDEDALRALAALEGLPAPVGPHVVAEVEGVVAAAMRLPTGPVFGDPFRPTAHLAPLLELQAKQLTGEMPRPRPVASWESRPA
ncbi:MAG TPA: hypothetical protein VLV28_08380 [Gaiellaceae bacterium]|nr:hypothetical protein [Gaiellaceae bacterium]